MNSGEKGEQSVHRYQRLLCRSVDEDDVVEAGTDGMDETEDVWTLALDSMKAVNIIFCTS